MAIFVRMGMGMVVVMVASTGMGVGMLCLPVRMILPATLFAHLW
jgi:hypothetical protein